MEAETPRPAICYPALGSVPVFLTTPAEAISSLYNFVHGELYAVDLIHQELFFVGSVKDVSPIVSKVIFRRIGFQP
jgi:hypothetical protein